MTCPTTKKPHQLNLKFPKTVLPDPTNVPLRLKVGNRCHHGIARIGKTRFVDNDHTLDEVIARYNDSCRRRIAQDKKKVP